MSATQHDHDEHEHEGGQEEREEEQVQQHDHDDEHHNHGSDHGRRHRHDHGDGHGHDHGSGHGHATGVRSWVESVFRPHSHDSADSVDSALESSERGIRALKVSLVALLTTAVLQGVVVAFSGSVALLADTVHNLADAGTAVPLWVAFWLGRRPANRRYTYGYGRAEDLAGLFVVLMIAASAVVAGWEAVRRLLDPAPVHNLWWVAVAGVIGFVGNELVATYRIRVGRDIGSAALVADGLHARTDGMTSLAVVAGAAGVGAGFPLADPIVGLAIMVSILFVLRSALRDVFARLMDAVDPALLDAAETALASTAGVEGVTRVRMRWIGHRLHADADLEVDRGCSAVSAHDVAHRAEEALVAAVPKLTAAVVHAYPAAVRTLA
jgi:cation diffusion facilitator family transporter